MGGSCPRLPPPTFKNGWERGRHREQKNSKQVTDQTVVTVTKALTKTTLHTQRSCRAAVKRVFSHTLCVCLCVRVCVTMLYMLFFVIYRRIWIFLRRRWSFVSRVFFRFSLSLDRQFNRFALSLFIVDFQFAFCVSNSIWTTKIHVRLSVVSLRGVHPMGEGRRCFVEILGGRVTKIGDQPINTRNLVGWLSLKSFPSVGHILRLKFTKFDSRRSSDYPFVSSSVCVLDEVWHFIIDK